MSNVTSISLTDEAYQVVQEYMEKNNCSRNRAINDIIKEAGEDLDLEIKLGKANLKMSKEIDKKLDELKVILTTPSEEE